MRLDCGIGKSNRTVYLAVMLFFDTHSDVEECVCLRPCVEECYDTVYCGYEQQTGINDTNQNEFNRKVQSLHDETYIYMHICYFT